MSPWCSFAVLMTCTLSWQLQVQPVAKVPGFRTSGKESMSCFVYINLEKLPEA